MIDQPNSRHKHGGFNSSNSSGDIHGVDIMPLVLVGACGYIGYKYISSESEDGKDNNSGLSKRKEVAGDPSKRVGSDIIVSSDSALLNEIISQIRAGSKVTDMDEDHKSFYSQHKEFIDKMVKNFSSNAAAINAGVVPGLTFSDAHFSMDGYTAAELPSYYMVTASLTYRTNDDRDIAKANKIIKDNQIPSFMYGYGDDLVRGVGSVIHQEQCYFKEIGDGLTTGALHGKVIDLLSMNIDSALVCFDRDIVIYPVFTSKLFNILGAPIVCSKYKDKTYGAITVSSKIMSNSICFSNYTSTRHIDGKGFLFCKGDGQNIATPRYYSKLVDSGCYKYFAKPLEANSIITVLRKES